MCAAYAIGCEIADRADAAALARGVQAVEREFWDSLATGQPAQVEQPAQAAQPATPEPDPRPQGTDPDMAQVIQLRNFADRANRLIK